jgi:hypothetical protein
MRKTCFNCKFGDTWHSNANSPRQSLHHVAAQIVMPKSSGQRAMKLLNLCPYKTQARKKLFSLDYKARGW